MDISPETIKARKSWTDVIQTEKAQQSTKSIHLTNFSIIVEGKIKSFHDKGRLRKFMTARSGLQRTWEEVRDSLEKDQHPQERTGANGKITH